MFPFPPPTGPPGPKVSGTVLVVCLTALLLGTMGLYGFVATHGGSQAALLQYLGLAVVPTLMSMASYLTAHGVRRRVDDVADRMDTVSEQIQQLPVADPPDPPEPAPPPPAR